MKRIFCRLPTPAPSSLDVEGAVFHHLVHVLRAQTGEALEVFDGQGRSFDAVVLEVKEEKALLQLGEERKAPTFRPIYVVQGLPKGDKLETVMQKCTELGAAGFFPVDMARSVVRLDEKKALHKTTRWQKIVEEAARQCGRADVPGVARPRPLLEALKALPQDTHVLVMDEEEKSQSLAQAFSKVQPHHPLAFVIGPEGGLAPEERSALLAHGGIPVTLGPRILRTETAPLVALSVLLFLDKALGD